MLFFFNDTATTEIYTLSLHDALPILAGRNQIEGGVVWGIGMALMEHTSYDPRYGAPVNSNYADYMVPDRKSTRLNSSHSQISYAVFCLKKKTKNAPISTPDSAPTDAH